MGCDGCVGHTPLLSRNFPSSSTGRSVTIFSVDCKDDFTSKVRGLCTAASWCCCFESIATSSSERLPSRGCCRYEPLAESDAVQLSSTRGATRRSMSMFLPRSCVYVSACRVYYVAMKKKVPGDEMIVNLTSDSSHGEAPDLARLPRKMADVDLFGRALGAPCQIEDTRGLRVCKHTGIAVRGDSMVV